MFSIHIKQSSSTSVLLALGAGEFFTVGLFCALYNVQLLPGLHALDAAAPPRPPSYDKQRL